MGLFSFIKNAGAKIFGSKEKATPTVAAPTAPAAPSQEELDSRKADQLVNLIKGLGFEIDNLYVAVEDDTATIVGKAGSQADKEKVILAVGNVDGIATVDDRLEVEVEEPVAVFYTVKSGDSLSKIAKAHYGDAMQYPAIFEANKPMLKHADDIYPGQVLRIPNLA